MASRKFDIFRILGIGRTAISGSFRPAGTGAPTNVVGPGFTVARTSIGLYTVTFTDVYVALVSAHADVRVADAVPWICQMGDFVLASKTLQIRTLKQDTAGDKDFDLADMSADADNVVNFTAIFRNSSVNF